MSTEPILETTDLSKRYAGQLALNALNLTVRRGEIFGYLGPNGAGKSTTIRLLLDLIRPTAGSARILGMDTRRDSVQIKRYIGNLPGEVRFWEHLTGLQVIQYVCGLRPGCDMVYALELAERFSLNLNGRMRDYSTGNKRKIGLIQALMHRPPLLILDEPTTGLDPLMQQIFNDLMLEIRDEGRTVFLSSHVLSEVDSICDRVGILRHGTLQAVEKVSDIKRVQYRQITIYTDDSVGLSEWSALPGVTEITFLAGGVQLRVTGALDPVIKQAALLNVRDMHIEEPRLEDVFLAYYGND